ncbi:MAG: respiratory nitrate reductase subunit gamma [Vicinamibacteraceae bacterium]|nr:respiratory nitrate reductase subunit gamma [Vicinamibacteraceae bacterium]
MAVLLLVWVWLAAAVFVVACVARAWRYARAPVHLRWDLYPVAHEPAARRAYGGSYLEEREWWTRPRERSLAGEVSTMLSEALLLHGVWVNNRRLFWGSLPFHWGLYLLVATSAGLLVVALGGWVDWLLPVLAVSGGIGGAFVTAGALWLLRARSTDRGLRRYTTMADRLNLLTFAALGATSAAVALTADGMPSAAAAVTALLRFTAPVVGPLLAAQMLLAGLILFYLPFTRMVHFFAKYFLYHDVRWDDRPMVAGSAMERGVKESLAYGVGWSAEHIGRGSWVDVATAPPPTIPGKKP